MIAKEDRRVLFRGYVAKPRIKNIDTRELTCKGEEDLLLKRYSGRYAYQASTHYLAHAFQSDMPSQTADSYGVSKSIGLLAMANSMIPFNGNVVLGATTIHYDWWAYGSDWIYKLAGLGLDSRIGSANIYADGVLLPRVSSFATLQATAISCWSDANDLWVRLDDGGIDDTLNHNFGPKITMLAENCYDTGIRMGTIDLPGTLLTGNLQLNYDRILDTLIDLAEFYGLNPRFRREADHTYLDCLDDDVGTEFTLPEENIDEITQSYNSDQLVHALIGKGVGDRDCQHVYTPSNHSWKGVWIEDAMDVDEGYLDALGNLKPYVDAEYALRLADEQFTIVPTADWGHFPACGDMIRLKLKGESERLLQVVSAKTDDKGKYEMEIGGRKSDLIDAFNSKSALNRTYYNEYLTEYGKAITNSGSALVMGDVTHGWCGGGSVSITVPASWKEADWSHRVTMDISITTDQPPVACMVLIQVGGGSNFLMQPKYYLLGDSISGLDITRLVNYGSATTVGIWIMKLGEWSGAACANHPTFDLSTTIRGWKRPLYGTTTPKTPIKKISPKYLGSWSAVTRFVGKAIGYAR